MHTVHARLPVPYFTPGDLRANTRTVASWLPSPPPAREVVFYGGLGALAVAGALEWPVALAIGGAAMVVRGRQREVPKESREAQQSRESGRATKQKG